MKSSYPETNNNCPEEPDKISEAQANYGTPRDMAAKPPGWSTQSNLWSGEQAISLAKPSSPRTIGGLEASEEVWHFVEKNQLFPHLETAIRLIHACFPTVKTIKLAYEIDWERENESWIGMNIQVPGEVDNVLQQYLRFNREIIRQIPSTKANMILLGIDGLESGSSN